MSCNCACCISVASVRFREMRIGAQQHRNVHTALQFVLGIRDHRPDAHPLWHVQLNWGQQNVENQHTLSLLLSHTQIQLECRADQYIFSNPAGISDRLTKSVAVHDLCCGTLADQALVPCLKVTPMLEGFVGLFTSWGDEPLPAKGADSHPVEEPPKSCY